MRRVGNTRWSASSSTAACLRRNPASFTCDPSPCTTAFVSSVHVHGRCGSAMWMIADSVLQPLYSRLVQKVDILRTQPDPTSDQTFHDRRHWRAGGAENTFLFPAKFLRCKCKAGQAQHTAPSKASQASDRGCLTKPQVAALLPPVHAVYRFIILSHMSQVER